MILDKGNVDLAELKAALRHRRADDSGSGDDDPGLPRSPPTSPTTLDVLNHGLKASSRATQSTCSDGSLLSMGSSENDEDSLGAGSHHSSKVSLLEHRHQVVDHEPVAGAAPLSHQAALHKIAVRPRRTHGVPRSRRATQIGLPDVIEEANSRNLNSQKLLTSTPPSPASPAATTTTTTTASQPAPLHTSPDEDGQKRETEGEDRKELEEKKEEPLFQRLFGSNSSNSKRAGRRASRERGEECRENSVSPLRHSDEQRASRDGKKRESSGSRFPGVAVSKPRQEPPHPLPPSGRPREPSRERSGSGVAVGPQEVSPGPASATVTMPSALPETSVRSTAQDDRPTTRPVSYPSRPVSSAVRKVKSFKEVIPGQAREPVRQRAPSQTGPEEVEEPPSKPARASRLSASLENIDGGDGAKKPQINLTSITKQPQQEPPPASPQRSSTESLATTPLPGVFIRPHPTSRPTPIPQTHQSDSTTAQDSTSGPFSLDSNVGTASGRGRAEVELRKAASVDQVGSGVELAPVHRRSRQQHPDQRPATDVVIVSAPTKAERKIESMNADKKGDVGKEEKRIENVKAERRESVKPERRESVKPERRESVKPERRESVKPERRESVKVERRESVKVERRESIKIEGMAGDVRRLSGQLLRSHSLQHGEDNEVKTDSSEGGEGEEAPVLRRQLRKEPSLKRAPSSRDSGDLPVPEFMRIQLNRVESKGQAVIYDTEQERSSRHEEPVTIQTPPTATQMALLTKDSQELEAESERCEQNTTPSSASSTKTPGQLTKKSSFQNLRGIMKEGSVGGLSMEGELGLDELASDRVQLRKPSVTERVTTAATGSGSQTPPPPSRRWDQPELFKVFARRSFKVKDSDREKLELADAGEEENATGEVSEVMVTPVRAPATPHMSGSATQTPLEPVQKPTINAISYNRKSVGNPALSFIPPAAATTSSPLAAKSGLQYPSISAVPITSTTTEISPTPPSSIGGARSITTVPTAATSQILDTPRRPKRNTSPSATPAASDAPAVNTTTTTTPQAGNVVSKIINRRLSEVASTVPIESESASGASPQAQIRSNQSTPTHTKPPFTSRPSASLIWPPRPSQDEVKEPEPIETQQSKVTVSDESEGSSREVEREEVEVVVSSLDIGAARRRFMRNFGGNLGSNVVNDIGSAKESQEISSSHSLSTSTSTTTPTPTPTASQPPQTSTTTAIPGAPSGIMSSILSRVTPVTPPPSTAAPLFTVTVRTQPPPSQAPSQPEPSPTPPLQPSPSPTADQGTPEKTAEGAAEDWRVLVRQRREGRLKQTKTPEAEEIIIETRPSVSRNSKVLEMASNFQKLQVA